MTDNKMPMMLDNAMAVDLNAVDDLFGEAVGLSLPVRTQGKQLSQRMDELRSRGSYQSIAWSRTGTIASITADGQSVELRYLRRHPGDGSWDLSEPTICKDVSGSPTVPLVHLSFSSTTSPDLAVVDAVGRLIIISFSICLNNPYIQRKWDTDPVDDMHATVGSYWLFVGQTSSQSYNVMYGPANKHGNGYQYESSFVHAGGPAHPIPSKSVNALFTITTNGTLKMFWSSANRFEETTMELESVNSSDDLVTHATMASEKNHLLLALATTSKQLRLVKIDINWGGGNQSAQTDKNSMAQNKAFPPTLVEKHLATTSWLQGGPNDANYDASMTELSHLEVLPSLLDSTGKNTVPPMVMAIRSRAPNEGSFQIAQSIIERWEAVEQRQGLHSAFEQLGHRRNSVSSELPNVTHLRKVDSVIINKVVIAFNSINFGKVLVLAFADGSVEYRDRFTFAELYTTEETTRVMNLRQVGWAFADKGPCQQVAFSPTFCSMIQMGEDGKVRWNKLRYSMGDIGNTMQDAHYAASIAGLTVTAAPSIFYLNNYDDVLAMVRPFAKKRRFTQDMITEFIKILKIQVDYSEDAHHDGLVRNGSLQSCLSIMNALGFHGELQPRSFHGKYSMLSLNVRNVVVLVTIASNTPLTYREKLSPLDEPEVVTTLAGAAKWSLDFLAWLIDSLYELMNDSNFTSLLCPQRYNEMSAFLHGKNNVALHVILCSTSRGFLSAVCRRIGHLEALSLRAIEFYRRQSAMGDSSTAGRSAPQLQQAYQRMQQVTSAGLVKVDQFEKLLNILGQDIRQTYQAFLPNLVTKSQHNQLQGKQIDGAVKAARVQFELAMLLASTPPPAFLALITKFFKQDLRAFQKTTDPSRLFFADYGLLEAQDDKHSLAARRASGRTYVDTFNRTEITMGPDGKWRRCTRCAAVMVDVFGSRPGFTFVLGQQRKCSCSGHWILLPKGKTTAT